MQYMKTFRCSEEFPLVKEEILRVVDGRGKLVEVWEIVHRSRKQFTVRVNELVPE